MRNLSAQELAAVSGGFFSSCKPKSKPKCTPKPKCAPKPKCGTPPAPTPDPVPEID